jgi:hypothetical protein
LRVSGAVGLRVWELLSIAAMETLFAVMGCFE